MLEVSDSIWLCSSQLQLWQLTSSQVAGISSRLQGEFKADTVLVLVSFFQAVIKSASSGVLLKEEGSPHIFKATTEALNSLGYGLTFGFAILFSTEMLKFST